MEYYSLHHKAPKVSFKEAVIRGLAPDKGLYFPSEIKPLPEEFFKNMKFKSKGEIAYEVIQPFVDHAIPEVDLRGILEDTLSFDFPLVEVEKGISSLELFHGPTLAFKDVGARFMARCLGFFNQESDAKVTVLVATSGDTGSAVAHGFYKVPGVEVVILYPKGKVSAIQEKQLTTLGENITALEVEGTFDDCQAMVKQAFLDPDFIGVRKLTSANSINVARWLPQMFYYFFAYQQLTTNKPLVFSVSSGNFGNLCAGLMAQKLGLPIQHFVAGTNANDVVPRYLQSGNYAEKLSVATISNAMDVGAPSNFIRIQELFGNDFENLKKNLHGFSFTDAETKTAMEQLFLRHGYSADPHGAVGYLALKSFLKDHPNYYGVFLETAHPVKFLDVLPFELQQKTCVPEAIVGIMDKEKKAEIVSAYAQLKIKLLN